MEGRALTHLKALHAGLVASLKLVHGRHLQAHVGCSQHLCALHLQRLAQCVGLCNVGCHLGFMLLVDGSLELRLEVVSLPPAQELLAECNLSCCLRCKVRLCGRRSRGKKGW